MPRLSVTPLKIGTLRRLAAAHPFFADWDLGRLKAVEPFCQRLAAASEGTVLELGAMDPYVYFLVAGEVQLEAGDGGRRSVRAGDLDAGFPVAHLRPSRYRVRARPGAELIRMEGSQLKRFSARPGAVRFRVDDGSVGGSWRAHGLVNETLRRARGGTLEVPSMPGIAIRIRRALARENGDMAGMAAIVGADPAIAGRLIRVANSAAFGGRGACQSVQAALVRLGVSRAQGLVLALATRDLFQSRAAHLNERMLRTWRHAIDVASLAAVLARLTPGLDGDRGLLIALLHEIGALPVLRLAEGYDDLAEQPGVLDEIITALTPELSALVLEQWGCQEDFVTAALNQNNWFRAHDGEADYSDVLTVAHLHAMVRERAFHRLPRIDETPAFARLALGQLSPRLSLAVLDEARGQIQELKTLLA